MELASRRAFLLKTTGAAFLATAAPALSQSHAGRADFTGLDEFVKSFIEENRVPGAALAITKDSRLVYARSFGLADRESSRAVQTTDLFRIASITKSITAVAVLQAIERGKVALDDNVWQLLALPEPADARWKAVTVRQLLLHTGGWDRETAKFDPMFQSVTIANAIGTTLPLAPRDVVRYMLARPLDFDPGSRHAYSNFGYCLLGRVIERVSGETYEAYVAKHVLAPLGIRRMRLAKTPPAGKAATEVTYYEEKEPNGRSVAGPAGEMVPAPRGTWWLETMDAHGGWLGSAVDVVRFGSAFDVPARCPILRPESIGFMFAQPEGDAGAETGGNYVGYGWFVWPRNDRAHGAYTTSTGLMSGTSSYLMRRHDGINWAVLFNTGYAPDGRPVMLKFRDASAAVLNAMADWPTTDQFAALL